MTGAQLATQTAWLSPSRPDSENDSPARQDKSGRLLWLHPVHLVEIDAAIQDPTVAAAQLAPPFRRSVEIADGHFVPGIGWSAIVTDTGAPNPELPLRLTELHWAYIALYMQVDRGLLALLDDDRWSEDMPLPVLEADADRVFADYLRVMEARARLDSRLASLGGDEFAIWEAISDVQNFEPLVQGVERKVEVLQRVAERRVQQASAIRARQTTGILSGLTALTVVTVAVALLGNFLGSRADTLGHFWWRTAIVGVALAVSIAVYWQAFRELKRRERRRLMRLNRVEPQPRT